MAKHDCEVCQGRGLVRLPLYKKVAFDSRLEVVAPETHSREYPCPECGTKANVERVFAVDAHATVDVRCPEEAMPHVARGVAHRIAGMMLDKGFIEFEKRPARVGGFDSVLIGTAWLVHPAEARRSIEDRIRERQQQLATVAADLAIKRIDAFGPFDNILKDDVAQFVRGAVRDANKNWSKAHELHARGVNLEGP